MSSPKNDGNFGQNVTVNQKGTFRTTLDLRHLTNNYSDHIKISGTAVPDSEFLRGTRAPGETRYMQMGSRVPGYGYAGALFHTAVCTQVEKDLGFVNAPPRFYAGIDIIHRIEPQKISPRHPGKSHRSTWVPTCPGTHFYLF